MVSWLKSSPLAHLPWVIRTLLRTAPVDTAVNLTASLIQGVVPAAVLLLMKLAVDAVTAGAAPAAFSRILLGLAGLLILKEAPARSSPPPTTGSTTGSAPPSRRWCCRRPPASLWPSSTSPPPMI